MRTFLLTCAILAIFAVSIQTQSTASPQQGRSRLDQEIDKGKDVDDPAKMIRYWDRIESGQITASELALLRELSLRPSTRVRIGPDSELYMTVLSAKLLKQHEERQRHAQEIASLQNQLNALGARVTELNTTLLELRKTYATHDR